MRTWYCTIRRLTNPCPGMVRQVLPGGIDDILDVTGSHFLRLKDCDHGASLGIETMKIIAR